MNVVTSSSTSIVDPGAILNARITEARTPHEVSAALLKEAIHSSAAALKKIEGAPILQAKIGVIMFEHFASKLAHIFPVEQISSLFSDQDRLDLRGDIQILRAAFSLSTEVLQEFRDSEPTFAFSYAVIQGLLHGRTPVIFSDLKDTLSSWVESKKATAASARELRSRASFPGVFNAINEALKSGPFFIITGDEHHTVANHFLVPNGWVRRRESDADLTPRYPHSRNLIWLPRTGMEVVKFDGESGTFLRSPMVQGLSKQDIELLREVTGQVSRDMNLAQYFDAPGRRYEYSPSWPPQSLMERQGLTEGQSSAAFFPAGQLLEQARPRFKSDPDNAPLLELIVMNVRRELANRGINNILVNRGGLSTIDFVTSDKGIGIEHVKSTQLTGDEMIVFLGDKIALNGNDRPAADVADVSVQLGDEWDWQLYPEGDRMLLRAKVNAKEGGAAEFIEKTTLFRRLALTGLFAPDMSVRGREDAKCAEISLPKSYRPAFNSLYDSMTKEIGEFIHELNSGHDLARIRSLKDSITDSVSVLSTHQGRFEDPIKQFHISILERVIQGYSPVLASDLKDTLAVFDAKSVEWFPNAKEAFQRALRTGPYFLITGDSLENIKNGFLLRSGILERENGHLKSSFGGIPNLHLITRTGLDRVIFNFASGTLDRTPLVNGISSQDTESVYEILNRVTKLFRCSETFAGYQTEEGYGPGYVDTRGRSFGNDAISFAYYPAGVLLTKERARFRAEMMQSLHFRGMVAEIRKLLLASGLDQVIAQQGGISTIDLTTSTKGSALAKVRSDLLSPDDFLVFLGDTITQYGNDGTAVASTDFSIQLGEERDPNLRPPLGHMHIHSPVSARAGGAALFLDLVVEARSLAGSGLWRGEEIPSVLRAIAAPLPGSQPATSYTDQLNTIPWETPLALKKLVVPNILLPGNSPIITNWAVITGATSAGKTTLLNALRELGYPVLSEVARGYVEQEKSNGRAIEDIRRDDHWFRNHVFQLTKDAEKSLLDRGHELIFFDRSSIDSLSFHRGSGYDPDEILKMLEPYRFKWVFHCTRLPFENDGFRTNNEPRRHFIDAALESDYRALGYDPIKLPVVSVDERVRMVLQSCGLEN